MIDINIAQLIIITSLTVFIIILYFKAQRINIDYFILKDKLDLKVNKHNSKIQSLTSQVEFYKNRMDLNIYNNTILEMELKKVYKEINQMPVRLPGSTTYSKRLKKYSITDLPLKNIPKIVDIEV